MSAEACADASERICGTLYEELSENPQYAGCVFLLYAAVRNEVDLSALFARLTALGRHCYYPAVSGDAMRFFRVKDAADFAEGCFGIREPVDRTEPYDGLGRAVVVAPGVSFSERGDRIGYGGGYYDRFLSAQPGVVKTIGVCYENQICNGIIPRDTDVPMDMIITEERIVYGR